MDSVMDDAAVALLSTAWGLGDVSPKPLPAGHTNSSYLVPTEQGPCIVRVSWPGKTAEQVHRERQAIRQVRGKQGNIAVPTVIPTREGNDVVRTDEGRWLHVFERIDGLPGLPQDPDRATTHAMHALARLHAALAPLPCPSADPLAWLWQRYERIRAHPAPLLPAIPNAHYDLMLDRAHAWLTAAMTWVRGPIQWLHGDFHAGNLLFIDHRVCGIVDFDEVGQGASWLEAAFAAFALSRDAERDDGFHFDDRRWHQAVLAYAEMIPGADATWWVRYREALMNLFCLDQVLIHIHAAQRRLWQPGPGMGFLGCWRALRRQYALNESQRSTASTVASRSSAVGEASCRQSTASSLR